jgi:Tol biopolymer transport system component
MTPDGAVQVRLTNDPALDAAPAVSRDGRIAFSSNRGGNWNVLALFPRKGAVPAVSTPAVEFGPVWSPDGKTVAFTRSSADPGLSQVYLDRSTGQQRQLTHLPGQNFAPSFSPTGDRVAFVHGEHRRFHIEIASLDGTVLADFSARTGHNADFDPAWSPSGTEIVFSRRAPKGNYDIWTMQVATPTERRLTTARGQQPDVVAGRAADRVRPRRRRRVRDLLHERGRQQSAGPNEQRRRRRRRSQVGRERAAWSCGRSDRRAGLR